MRRPQKKVICLAERGWEGIRKLTICLADAKVPSVCLIKGKLEKDILEMITRYDEISLISISRSIYKAYIFVIFLRNFLLQNTICIVMDNKKNYPWVDTMNRFLGIETILLEEKDHTYALFRKGKLVDIEFILNLAKK